MRQRKSNTDPAAPMNNGAVAAATRSAEPGTIAICFVAAALGFSTVLLLAM